LVHSPGGKRAKPPIDVEAGSRRLPPASVRTAPKIADQLLPTQAAQASPKPVQSSIFNYQ
jgi:hypothetical protein